MLINSYLLSSALYKAIEYTKDCLDDLFTFVDNGYLEMTNNLAERAVKPFVIQRKVFQTCKINNVNVTKYLEYVFNSLNKIPLEDLLPYSNKAPKNN